jgi:hypothetical protein
MKLVVLDISAKLRHRVHHISRSRSVADEAFGYPHVCKDELVKRDRLDLAEIWIIRPCDLLIVQERANDVAWSELAASTPSP